MASRSAVRDGLSQGACRSHRSVSAATGLSGVGSAHQIQSRSVTAPAAERTAPGWNGPRSTLDEFSSGDTTVNGNQECAGTTLRYEVAGVDYHRAGAVAALAQRFVGTGKMRAFPGNQEADDILGGEQRRTSTLGSEFVQHADPLPEQSRPCTGTDTGQVPGEGKVLTRKRRPSEIRCRQVRSSHVRDRVDHDRGASGVRVVNDTLLAADVVRPHGAELRFEPDPREAAASEEVESASSHASDVSKIHAKSWCRSARRLGDPQVDERQGANSAMILGPIVHCRSRSAIGIGRDGSHADRARGHCFRRRRRSPSGNSSSEGLVSPLKSALERGIQRWKDLGMAGIKC